MSAMEVSTFEWAMMITVLVIAVLALLYAWMLRRQIMKQDKGTPEMQRVWQDIKAGANAYLNTQFKAIVVLIGVLAVAMFFSVFVVRPTPEAINLIEKWGGTPESARLIIAIARATAFLMGSTFSLLVGRLGMNSAVEGNVRVAAAASKGHGPAMSVAYRSGTITGMLTDGLGLLGGTTIFLIFGAAAPDVLLGFGFGGTLLALFMRVGGGIYTKAADVGADLVGKVEAGIPEDDPRNPAVVADLVGDNVGDCAGMAADIFESYEVTIVSGLILGLTLYALTGNLMWIVFPLIIRAIGVISSIFGTYAVRSGPGQGGDAMRAIFRGFLSSAGISAALFFGAGF